MTCATPGIAINLGRKTQSAYSRTCMDEILDSSIGMAICIISPMIELMGPMRETMPSGIAPSIDESLSETICLAR